jgi:KaiC/GvpD/RAD55 family RecA-like ATPase
VVDSGGSLEASMVFEKLFTDYLKGQENDSMRSILLKRLERMRVEQPILKGIQIGDDGRVFINMREGSESRIVTILSGAFDSLMELAAYSIGQEKAFRDAETVVFAVMKQFNEPFLRLGIKDSILKGSMSDKLSSGVDGFDSILGGGLPRSDMILLTGPPGAAKYHFAFQFLAEGLKNGGAGLAVLSTMNIKEMRERLSRLNINVPSCEAKGRLKTVDWYSQKSKPIVGLEEHGHVLVPSKDIANLDIAFTRALEGLSFAPTSRATVDIITPALNIYELADVVEFVQRQKSRFREKEIASIFIVEEGAHDERVMTTLKHVSDGVISLSSDDQGRLFIEVESMKASKFKSGKIAIQISSKGMSVIGQVLDEANILSEFCNIPLVTKDIAQRLVDAGFTDLEKLSQASQPDLMDVNLVTKEVAKSIVDYTRTVEYSHSVLSSRSEKWLNKAI